MYNETRMLLIRFVIGKGVDSLKIQAHINVVCILMLYRPRDLYNALSWDEYTYSSQALWGYTYQIFYMLYCFGISKPF